MSVFPCPYVSCADMLGTVGLIFIYTCHIIFKIPAFLVQLMSKIF